MEYFLYFEDDNAEKRIFCLLLVRLRMLWVTFGAT